MKKQLSSTKTFKITLVELDKRYFFFFFSISKIFFLNNSQLSNGFTF